jgi:hypothetical protein
VGRGRCRAGERMPRSGRRAGNTQPTAGGGLIQALRTSPAAAGLGRHRPGPALQRPQNTPCAGQNGPQIKLDRVRCAPRTPRSSCLPCLGPKGPARTMTHDRRRREDDRQPAEFRFRSCEGLADTRAAPQARAGAARSGASRACGPRRGPRRPPGIGGGRAARGRPGSARQAGSPLAAQHRDDEKVRELPHQVVDQGRDVTPRGYQRSPTRLRKRRALS